MDFESGLLCMHKSLIMVKLGSDCQTFLKRFFIFFFFATGIFFQDFHFAVS